MKLFIENNDFLNEDLEEDTGLKKFAISFDVTVDSDLEDINSVKEFINECFSSKDGVEIVSDIDIDIY